MPIEPYYSEGGITIFCGDCREILPTLQKHDLLLTDPPYGIGVNHSMGRRAGDAPSTYMAADWDSEAPSSYTFEEMFTIANSHIVWGANHFIDRMPYSSACWLVWDKKFSNDVSFASCELAYTSIKGVVKKHEQSSARKNGLHPTQKPVALMRWCLSFAPDAKTILDPFAGSCTTGVAAKLEGRKATLIEINERYCEIGANRLRQGVLDFGE